MTARWEMLYPSEPNPRKLSADVGYWSSDDITFAQSDMTLDQAPLGLLNSGSVEDNLDPNFEWIQVNDLKSAGPSYIAGRCKHLKIVNVEISTGEVVAKLCTVCDRQLPGEGVYARV